MTIGLLKLRVLAASRDFWSSLLSARTQSLARMDAGPPIRVSLGGTRLRSPVSRVPNESRGEQEVVDLKATQPRSCDGEVSCLFLKQKKWRSLKRRSAYAFPGGNIYKTHHASTAFLFTRTIL